VAFIGYALLVGFPDRWNASWRFLTEKEVKLVINKVNKDRGDAIPEPFSLSKYLQSGLDWTIWIYALMFFNTTTIAYALAYFLPEILRDSLHYTAKDSQIMGSPPYVFSGFIMYAAGYLGDKYRIRRPIIVFNMILILIGLPLLRWGGGPKLRYFSLFLIAAGCNTNIPTIMTYQANNIRGQWKRAFCSATLVGFGGIGGIAGSLIFRYDIEL
jgi:MFS family permease